MLVQSGLLKSPNAENVIFFFEKLITSFGIPKTIVLDNGRAFTSQKFRNWAKSMNIVLLNSLAYHPQSNGQAERFVETFKRCLYKHRGEKEEDVVNIFLRYYRNTPNYILGGKSPCEIMFGRKLNSKLSLMNPVNEANHLVERSVEKSFHRNRFYLLIDKNGTNETSWKEGSVISVKGNLVKLLTTENKEIIRHNNHIKKRIEREIDDGNSSAGPDSRLQSSYFLNTS